MAQVQPRPVEYPSHETEKAPKPEFGVPEEQSEPLLHLRVLWNGRRSIAKAAMIGLISATVLAFLLPRRYTSTTKLMPPDGQSNPAMTMLAALTGKGNGLAGMAGDLLGMKGSGAVFVGILQSETVQNRLIQRFDLKRVYWDRLDEDARKDLEGRTSIAEDRKSGIITISVTDRDPKRATAMAHAYVEELNRLSAELSTSAAHRERVFLEERLKGVQQDLEAAEKDFSQFASKNMALDIKEQGKAMVEAAAMLQGQLIAAEAQLEGLRQIYNNDNVRVRSVEAQISKLKQQLEKVGGKGDDTATDSSSSKDELYPSIKKLPLLGVTWADMYRRTKVQEAVFEVLTQQYELAKVEEAKETPSVKVLDEADHPERKSYPPRMPIILFGAVLGVAGGVFWLILRYRWDQTDPTDPRKKLAEEVFQSIEGHMPWAPPNGSRVQAIAHRVWTRFADRNGGSQDAGDVERRETME